MDSAQAFFFFDIWAKVKKLSQIKPPLVIILMQYFFFLKKEKKMFQFCHESSSVDD